MSHKHQEHQEEWDYDEQNSLTGPSEWNKLYKTGQHQSPINILIDANCLALKSTTCCINSRLDLITLSDNSHNQKQNGHHRAHLDSVGEEARAGALSPSSSGISSNRSSPTQTSGSDFEDNGFDDGDRYDVSRDKFRRHRCAGKGHSAQRQNTRFCLSNKKIFLGYPRYLNSLELNNNGHSWQVTLPPELGKHTRKYAG